MWTGKSGTNEQRLKLQDWNLQDRKMLEWKMHDKKTEASPKISHKQIS